MRWRPETRRTRCTHRPCWRSNVSPKRFYCLRRPRFAPRLRRRQWSYPLKCSHHLRWPRCDLRLSVLVTYDHSLFVREIRFEPILLCRRRSSRRTEKRMLVRLPRTCFAHHVRQLNSEGPHPHALGVSHPELHDWLKSRTLSCTQVEILRKDLHREAIAQTHI